MEGSLLGISALAVAAVLALVWWRTALLDVLALGRHTAVALGVDHDRAVDRVLMGVAVLVPVAGPRRADHLPRSAGGQPGYRLTGTFRHRWTIPTAAFAGVVALVGAQIAIEEYLDFGTRAGGVVNFVGGTYLIVLLLREAGP